MINRMMLCQILTSEYEVLEAENGQAALDILGEYGERISLILLDIVMPVMDGYTFLSRMKADSSYASIPVIVTTQRDGESDEVAALSHGATDFVAKPYKPQIILHRVASIINLRETAAMINLFQYDRLTGLYSKEFFYQRVRDTLSAHPDKKYDIMCSDIENFKLINDIFGIPAGDQLLCGVAQLYQQCVGSRGICGRFNADQFACLMEHSEDYSDEMFIDFTAKVNELSPSKNIVMKWGIYHINDTTLTIEQICDRALLAVRSIKGQYGVYFARYDDQLRSKLLREQAITDSMAPALADGQFEIYLQPKYRIHDDKLAGAEALIRWNHPEWGMQSPGEFIPLFEKNGFITRLDQFVWNRACEVLRAWDDRGYPKICVSVNVSRADIYNADIADILLKIVEKNGLEPSRLHLEITESAYTENPAQIINTVGHLRELGFIIEMDDFGSGYSSLNMLNEMPIDILKLDMKFIQNETAKPENQGILRFIMGLARWMKLSVVAEGVETKEQLERLREIGCDYVQGYYFAKPMNCESFEALLTSPHYESADKAGADDAEGSLPTVKAAQLDAYFLSGQGSDDTLCHMQDMLNDAPMAVYVSATDNYELLYANKLARQLFLNEREYCGMTCYEAAGFDQLCPFCHMDKISRTDYYIRDFTFPGDGRTYRLYGKIIDWDRRPAHIEYILDHTDQTISDKLLHQLSVASCDLVVDADLINDTFTVISRDENAGDVPDMTGRHSDRVAYMLKEQVVPRDRPLMKQMLDGDYIMKRLKNERSYTVTYAIASERGDILTKKLTVSAVDLRFGRICLARNDITDSVREQQSMLNLIAYTFELLGLIDVDSRKLTMHTRQTVQENLSPYVMDDYESAMEKMVSSHFAPDESADTRGQFRLETILGRLKENPTGYDFVFRYVGEDGLRYKQVNVLWGDENHKIICMVRADVTDMLTKEYKSREALQKALAMAREASRAKSDFLSSMSHDIRTPMNAIMGMTALAAAHLDEKERVADYLKKISVSSSHLLSLINDVLDMSKLERSQIRLNRMRISLRKLMEQLAAIVKPQTETAGLDFVMEISHLEHDSFYGDLQRIQQILLNILSNAVKFTPKGGRVEFLAEELAPQNGARGVRYRFTVRDDGMGMPEQFLEHIFDPFTRSPGAQYFEGTGLGLSIARGLVELMGGCIRVESREQHGTIFYVELELERDQQPADGTEARAACTHGSCPLSGRHFLVAEDNAINAEILCELLAMEGAATVVKTDGRQAVRAFTDAPAGTFDAILMDIQMPEMNGYEATRAIRQSDCPDAADIPIVAMTANAFAEDIQACMDAGMNAHVAKPVDIHILRDTLRTVLRFKQT